MPLGEGRCRVVIENIYPEVNGGEFPVKRVRGESLVVTADIFADGHQKIAADLLWRKEGQVSWQRSPMRSLDNDRWEGSFVSEQLGRYEYTLEGWIDRFASWQEDCRKKHLAKQNIENALRIGLALVEEVAGRADSPSHELEAVVRDFREGIKGFTATALALSPELGAIMRAHDPHLFSSRPKTTHVVVVEQEKALFSTWYEMFPRSASSEEGRHGTFKDCISLLPHIAAMGFDVLYLPPVHPVGRTLRKGKNNASTASADDPGSPWAIGSEEGGHDAVYASLGTLEDFAELVEAAKQFGIDIALDVAFQCSRDHPYLRSHPEWFRWRPDGTIQYAENPPKKYEDIVPLDFESENWQALWEELLRVVLVWVERGVKIFRVDNPHTKPFRFWEWMIGEVKARYPDTVFLSEAFTRPKVMFRLAKAGFSQSYTYFTWRYTKSELTQYLTELTSPPAKDFFRPNFWPNTPDILPEHLQYGGKPAFIARLVMAATLSSNYGIYGPPFDRLIRDAVPGKEEYRNSEKYELKHWDWSSSGHIRDFIAHVNAIRRDNPALQATNNVMFLEIENPYLLAYLKRTPDSSNMLLIVVNLDALHPQEGMLTVPLRQLGIGNDDPYMLLDLLSNDTYVWQGSQHGVGLDPQTLPAAVYRIKRRLKRESDFDYYM